MYSQICIYLAGSWIMENFEYITHGTLTNPSWISVVVDGTNDNVGMWVREELM